MTPEEKSVVESAIYLRYCIDAKTAGDPPRIGRLLDAVDALIYSCPQCNAGGHTCPGDGNGIGHTQTDCGQHDEDPGDLQPSWWIATFAELLPGDQIRIQAGADAYAEATVTKVHRGQWHAKGREWVDDAGKVRDHMTPWEHEELRIDLTANPGMHVYPPDLACEILADAERAAILALQAGFPGTQPTRKTWRHI